MRNSEKNLMVIENFILHLTHCGGEEDAGFKEPQTYTPQILYKTAKEYIEEDHVDGKEADNIHVTRECDVCGNRQAEQ